MSACGPDCRPDRIRGVRLADGSRRVTARSEGEAGDRDPAASRLPWARRVLLGLIAIYKLGISPLLPPACRFYPTCSEYAARAIAHRGLLRGTALAAWRLLRCNPFSPGGYDPGPWSQDGPGGAA